MTDLQIIENILTNNNQGINAVYTIANKHLIKMVLKNSGSPQDAADIVQDTVIIFYSQIKEGLILSCKISTYLYAIAWNLWRKEIYKRKKYNTGTLPEGSYEQTEIEKEEAKSILDDAIELLAPSAQRLIRAHLSGMNIHEIAKECNFKNTNSAKSQLSKTKKALSGVIKELYSAEDVKNY